jgi:hypothetical protein
MEKIYQSRDIQFSAVTNKSLIAMVPVMDALIKDINGNRYADLWDARTSEERKVEHLRYPNHNNSFRNMTPKQIENAYRVLEDIGFVGSGEVEIMTDEALLAANTKE